MKKHIYYSLILLVIAAACGDNDLGIDPKTENYPFRLMVDADEGGDLPDAEDYDLEIKFADHIGKLPNKPVTIHYTITDMEDDMDGVAEIDKVVYEVELDDCVYERELDFTSTPTADGLSGTITLVKDDDLETLPESFEVVFVLPGLEETEGKFKFEITSLESEGNVILGAPVAFEYEVLDSDVAGEWEFEIATEEAFDDFKTVFAPLNAELQALEFEEITGKVTAEFEFGEMKFVIELVEEEEVTECEDGVSETETVNKEIEIEAAYDAEEGELEFEGSYFSFGDDGEINDEIDFIIEAEYELDQPNGLITFIFHKVIDPDHQEEGQELFFSEAGLSFTFEKD
jgi:hypothetical protein